jgi:hypothetical protein
MQVVLPDILHAALLLELVQMRYICSAQAKVEIRFAVVSRLRSSR